MKKLLVLILSFPLVLQAKAPHDYILLDVRTSHEFSIKHLENAQNIDFLSPDFESQITHLDKAKKYKLYCRSGNRSGKALRLMQALGFKHLENLGSLEDAQESLEIKCTGSC